LESLGVVGKLDNGGGGGGDGNATEERFRDRALFIVALHTAMRMTGLRNLQNRSILGAVTVSPPSPSTSTVTSHHEVLDLVTTPEKNNTIRVFRTTPLMKRVVLEAARYQTIDVRSNGYLFGGDDSSLLPPSANAIQCRIRRIFRRAGIPAHLAHVHAIRKTTITALIDDGVPLSAVSKWVGHASIATR
jgi:integrase